MRAQFLLLLAATCLLAAYAPQKAKSELGKEDQAKQERAEKRNLERWQGTFKLVAAFDDGEPMSPEEMAKRKLTVKGNEYHFQNGSFSEHGKYKFDVSTRPKQVDIIVSDGKDKGKVYQAVFDANDQGVMICFEKANKKRPSAFVALKGTGCISETWARVKE
jgi:uncharacterized protein (TIGR03067 family)